MKDKFINKKSSKYFSFYKGFYSIANKTKGTCRDMSLFGILKQPSI
jgi:hypothetical protein